ncbi:1-deoxy-D-xylulose-5-phosphate synthase [Marinococcus sp. PL1-022]|uniref:1-deoxy-D-xylulose-5-phosphate synthase n=1 Tax=Marinococcus sp. PL1-022 TaxID=3095363 RepID=UPI0029C52F85|nr:1-deoxy-D-xylulose-5-phosphate synthase [Marinococcus sp. PL1-022]MDX6153250.1 1-deoxy-D-xylulose-5-phosphate synthase [Marinococcus sp. PL1-022]
MNLETIQDPGFMKQYNDKELKALGEDIRAFLIEKLSVTGGHLGPNLGVVELTLTLHQLYNTPKDKLIWDVGHQSYVHKILTGRADRFDSLRQYQGLCGFPKRSESEHDVWETGHSSTSLSAAEGMALANQLKGEDAKVAAIIGDGALTGGMALEALNHIGHEQTDVTIILNDNEMSISPNVGALHSMLGRIRTAGTYRRTKEDVDHMLRRIPAFGSKLASYADRMKDSMKQMVLSGMFFEELGFTYLGPVDGHDLDDLHANIKYARDTNGPVIVHVLSKKGKGYTPAENDAKGTWHGLGPYKIESGEVIKKPAAAPAYSAVFSNTLQKIAEMDSRLVAVTAAMAGGTKLDTFAEKFPDRMFDVGIAEQHATTMSGALATQGMKPVFGVYSTFLQRGYDQLVHDVCRQNLNVLFGIDRAGLVGADGETHQGVFDIAYLRHLPNMKILMPKDENELQHMLYSAFHNDDGPTAVRYPRGNGLGVEMDEEFQMIPYGKWEIVREGTDCTILSFGTMLPIVEEAAAELSGQGTSVRIVNARSAKPLDEAMLEELAEEGKPVLTVEEAALKGSFGSAVLEYMADHEHDSLPVRRMGIADYYVEHGSVPELYEELGLTPEKVVEKVTAMTSKERTNIRG